MTELEYVLKNFDKHFSPFCGKKILLHGSREYAENILSAYDEKYHFLGIMTSDPVHEDLFCGKRIFHESDLAELQPEIVIFTERVKYEDLAYQQIILCPECRDTLLYNMYGVDERRVREEYECITELSRLVRAKLLKENDVIGFEVMDVFFSQVDGEIDKPQRRAMRVYEEARKKGKKVFFSLRRSFDQKKQIKALEDCGIREIPGQIEVISREGEDLSFRRICDMFPGKKTVYFGQGFVNEYLLPKCYGITPVRVYTYAIPFDVPNSLDTILRNAYKETSRQKDTTRILYQEIDLYDVISFDVFDTLLQRTALLPEDVFRLLAKRFWTDPREQNRFVECRIDAQYSGIYPTLEEIYNSVAASLELSESEKELLLEQELDIERSVICCRRHMTDIVDYAIKAGKTVVATSDMYLGSTILNDLLKENGYPDFERIFVSCEYRKAKTDGLFDELGNAYAGKTILHIGDNPKADGIAAEKTGFGYRPIRSALQKACDCGYEDVIREEHDLAERCMIGLCVANAFSDPFEPDMIEDLNDGERLTRFASMSVFPILIGYICYLNKMSAGYDRVLFSSRDGLILSELYNYIRSAKHPTLPESLYFYSSRHAAFQTCMDDPQTIGNTYLGKEQTLPSFVRNVYGVEPLPCEQNIGKEEYVRLHWDKICEKAETARANYRKYLRNHGLSGDKRYLFTDFVAIGTTQHYLQKFSGIKLHGCYIACPLYGEPYEAVDYYIDFGDDFFITNFMEMEYIMTSMEASLDCFDEKGQPVFAKEVRTEEDLQRIRTVHENILKLGKVFCDVIYEKDTEIDAELTVKMYAAEGYHGIVKERGYDDWVKQVL